MKAALRGTWFRRARRTHAGLLAILPSVFIVSGCFTTLRPKTPLDESRLASIPAFDDSDWAAVLEKHVDEEGRVDYAGLRRERQRLERFVSLIGAVGPERRPELFPSREDRLAYWINAYNALVLFNVIERPSLRSVNDDKKSFFYFTRFPLDGREINLYDLENDVIRRGFGEPRVHFALNCASRGCPRLPREPFRAASFEAQLDRETTRFLHEPRNVALEGGEILLSEIFQWYREDFAPSPVRWIAQHAPDLALPLDARVRFRDWDWRLNDR